MNQSWKDKHIEAWISLAGINGGTLKPLQLIMSGDNEGVFFVSPTKIRELQQTWPTIYWSLPDEKINNNKVILKTRNKEYRISDLPQLFEENNNQLGKMIY